MAEWKQVFQVCSNKTQLGENASAPSSLRNPALRETFTKATAVVKF